MNCDPRTPDGIGGFHDADVKCNRGASGPFSWRENSEGADMAEADTHTPADRERVLRALVTSDPTFSGYRVVEVYESDSGNKLTLVLVRKEVGGRGSLATDRDVA
jgi:hypothetical protein